MASNTAVGFEMPYTLPLALSFTMRSSFWVSGSAPVSGPIWFQKGIDRLPPFFSRLPQMAMMMFTSCRVSLQLVCSSMPWNTLMVAAGAAA